MRLKQFAFSPDEIDLLLRMVKEEIKHGHVTAGDEAWENPAEEVRTLLGLYDQLNERPNDNKTDTQEGQEPGYAKIKVKR